MARPSGDEGEGGLAMNACPGVGGMCDPGLVSHIDNSHSRLLEGNQDFIQMIADQGEHVGDAKPQACAGEEISTGRHDLLS